MPLKVSSSCCFASLTVQDHGSHIPQRLHRTCVLLWRLPKDEVPLAVVECQYRTRYAHSMDRRTHFGGAVSLIVKLIVVVDLDFAVDNFS